LTSMFSDLRRVLKEEDPNFPIRLLMWRTLRHSCDEIVRCMIVNHRWMVMEKWLYVTLIFILLCTHSGYDGSDFCFCFIIINVQLFIHLFT